MTRKLCNRYLTENGRINEFFTEPYEPELDRSPEEELNINAELSFSITTKSEHDFGIVSDLKTSRPKLKTANRSQELRDAIFGEGKLV